MAAGASNFKISFNKTPQAKGDVFTGATEDSTQVFKLDVMVNDAGDTSKSLYSIDGGTDTNALLQKDAVGAINHTQYADIAITADGQVSYQLTDAGRASLQQLNVGETTTDTFSYAIQLGNGTLSWATAQVVIEGVSDVATVDTSDYGFDNATHENWQGLGSFSVYINEGDYYPEDSGFAVGKLMFGIDHDGSVFGHSQTDLASYLQIDAASLNSVSGGQEIQASVIQTSISASSGQRIALDYLKMDVTSLIDNDYFLLVYLGDQQIGAISDAMMSQIEVHEHVPTTYFNFRTFEFSISSDIATEQISIVGVHVGDGATGHSEMFIDNLRVI
jgi:VCBS repeat-containing protein